MNPNGRLIALGASNLTRGLGVVVQAARQQWGDPVEIVVALGHGRSYGMTSFFLARSLPGILQAGLWRHLQRAEEAPTRALVTDVGHTGQPGPETISTPASARRGVRPCLKRAIV